MLSFSFGLHLLFLSREIVPGFCFLDGGKGNDDKSLWWWRPVDCGYVGSAGDVTSTELLKHCLRSRIRTLPDSFETFGISDVALSMTTMPFGLAWA